MFSLKHCAAWLLLTALLCAFFAAPSASAAGNIRGNTAEYRALLIGEQCFLRFFDDNDPDAGFWLDDEDQRNIGDVRNLTNALGNVVGPVGPYGPLGEAFRVTQKSNLSWSGIRNAIADTFRDTEDQDISIFFLATHGLEKKDGNLHTAFTGNPGSRDDIRTYWQHQYLSFETLAEWLKDNVKGRIFVILESCGSGSAIFDPDVPENKAGKTGNNGSDIIPDENKAAEQFVQRAVEAFAKVDPGVPVPAAEDGSKSTGNLRVPKFYVLTASAHREKSYGWETHDAESSYNFFTRWLIRGIGSKDDSPADTDSDGYLSLTEMFDYVKQYGTITDGSVTYHQHVQRYPIGNTDHLLKLQDPAAYRVTNLQGSPHIPGSGKTVKITVARNTGNDGILDRFDSVLVDGKKLGSHSFSISVDKTGNLVITLTGSYLDTVRKGDHTITILFTDGSSDTRITIGKVPKTGDNSHPGLWFGLMLLGLAGLIVIRFRFDSSK